MSFMVAGESGLGKSTLINSLFLTDLYKERTLQNAEGGDNHNDNLCVTSLQFHKSDRKDILSVHRKDKKDCSNYQEERRSC